MNRRGLFTLAGLLGALRLVKAQTGTVSSANPAKGTEFYVDNRCVGVSNGDGTLSPCKPKNGECPQCHTVAPKLRLPNDWVAVCVEGPTYNLKHMIACDKGALVRCAHCSAAFFQDAE